MRKTHSSAKDLKLNFGEKDPKKFGITFHCYFVARYQGKAWRIFVSMPKTYFMKLGVLLLNVSGTPRKIRLCHGSTVSEMTLFNHAAPSRSWGRPPFIHHSYNSSCTVCSSIAGTTSKLTLKGRHSYGKKAALL